MKIQRLKTIANIVPGQSPPSSEVDILGGGLPFIQGNAEFGKVFPTPVWECNSAPKVAESGDIILSVRAPVGAVNLSDSQLGIGRGVAALRSYSDENQSWLYWAMQAIEPELQARATGSTFKAVSAEDIGNIQLGVPRNPQQIADYLDHETAEIDALIFDLSDFMHLVEERHSAESSVLLTAGPDAETRLTLNHGIDWLATAAIPESWTAVKLGYVAHMQSGDALTSQDIDEQGRYPVYGGGGFRGYTDSKNQDTDRVLIGRQGALAGKVFQAQAPFFATEHAIVTYPQIEMDPTWFESMLRLMNLGQYSVAAAQPGIGVDVISKKKIPVPGHSTQRRIGDKLRQSNESIKELTRNLNEAIDLARERRAALITAAVTGQIDVTARNKPAAEQLEDDIAQGLLE